MASIAKPVLLAVIGILAVVLFLQTSSLITGAAIRSGNDTSPATADTNVSLGNVAPTVVGTPTIDVFANAPTPCAQSATVQTTVNVHDDNGITVDIEGNGGVTGILYSTDRYTAGSGCTVSDANGIYGCVATTCTQDSLTNNTDAVYGCDFTGLQFFADNGTWEFKATVTDGTETASATSATSGRSVLNAIDINDTYIYWGALSPGDTNQTNTYAINCGNLEQDLDINGTALSCTPSGDTITRGNITYALTGSGPFGQALDAASGTTTTEANTAVTTTTATNTSQVIEWHLNVPLGVSGDCSGEIDFLAVANQTIDTN